MSNFDFEDWANKRIDELEYENYELENTIEDIEDVIEIQNVAADVLEETNDELVLLVKDLTEKLMLAYKTLSTLHAEHDTLKKSYDWVLKNPDSLF